jgi:uncharacterized protein DUF6788
MPSPKVQRLTVRRQKLVQQLRGLGPVLRASLIERFTQCGKSGCKCMQGEKHGPAYYLTVSYAKGRTRQVYVPKDLLPLAEHWVRNYRQALTVLEEISGINLELIRLREAVPDR